MNATDEHGYSPRYPFGRRHSDADDSLGAGNETPVDLAAVQADDALLDMLGGNGQVSGDELARVLVAWRRDVDTEPIGQLVDVTTALRVILDAQAPRPTLGPWGALIASAALGATVIWLLVYFLTLVTR